MKEKIRQWAKLPITEKIKYNGFRGFCNNELYKDSSAFKRSKVKR